MINEKMSEFLLKLAMVDNSQCILDPVANLGKITTTLLLKNNKNNVHSFCQSVEHYSFLALQNKIIYDDIRNTHLMSSQDFIIKSFERNNNLNPDLIVAAFPFGNRHNLSELRYRSSLNLTNIEDYLIIASLETLKTNGRLVAIIPDNMLFAGGKREQLRRHIVERYCLRSIISLPTGVLSNSNAKASIIVIDKTDKATSTVFFGVVNKTDIGEKVFFVDEHGNPVGFLKEYEEFIQQGIVESSGSWKCFPIDSNVDNLRAETYLTINDNMFESKYPTYPISEICMSVKRGTAIKNIKNGAIPFLAPASIRPNKIDTGKLSFTNDENEIVPSYIVEYVKGAVVLYSQGLLKGSCALMTIAMEATLRDILATRGYSYVTNVSADDQYAFASAIVDVNPENDKFTISISGTNIKSVSDYCDENQNDTI